jgi:single-strand DNA-binding protein
VKGAKNMSLNKVILMGRLTADPELRKTKQGTSVAAFTLAVDRSYSKQGEQAKTDFFDCVAWTGTAEFVSRYFAKGQRMAISGRLQTRNWEDNDGKKRKATEVVVKEAHFADSKKGGSGAEDLRDSEDDFEPFDDNEDLPF